MVDRALRFGLDLLPRALERVAAGDPGDPQPAEGATWAGHFEDDDYVRVDWAQPARKIHDQVRAWHLTFGMSGLRAPVAELDGEAVVLLQTRLTDPGGEPAASSAATRDLGGRQRAGLAAGGADPPRGGPGIVRATERRSRIVESCGVS